MCFVQDFGQWEMERLEDRERSEEDPSGLLKNSGDPSGGLSLMVDMAMLQYPLGSGVQFDETLPNGQDRRLGTVIDL